MFVSCKTCPLITPVVSTMQGLSPTKCSSAVYLFVPFLCTTSPSETRKAHSRDFSTYGRGYGLRRSIRGSLAPCGDGASVPFPTCKYLVSHVKEKNHRPQNGATRTNSPETKPRFWNPSLISFNLSWKSNLYQPVFCVPVSTSEVL